MAVLAGLCVLLGMAGVAVALVMLIVQLIFKRGWTKKRIWTVGAISLTLFVVGMIIGLSSAQEGYEAGRQAAKDGQTAGQKEVVSESTPTSFVNPQTEMEKPVPNDKQKMLNAIKAEADFQDILNGKQKVVVYITNNNTHASFTGSVKVEVKSVDNKVLGWDIIYPEKLPPNGKTWGIIWAEPGGDRIETEVSGEFEEMNVEQSGAKFDIASTVSGLNYQTFYVVVPEIEAEELISVAKAFRKTYTRDAVLGFQIFFYSEQNRKKAEAKDINSAEANYAANYNNGLSELSMYATGERIEVKD